MFLVLRELGDEVDAASDLEGAGWLVVLVFYVGFGAEELIEGWVGV